MNKNIHKKKQGINGGTGEKERYMRESVICESKERLSLVISKFYCTSILKSKIKVFESTVVPV